MNKLNFGCARDLREDWDNVDIKDFDFNEFPYPVKSNTYDHVEMRYILEHLKHPKKVMEEIHRITKPLGTVRITVPYYNCQSAYNTLDHIQYFNLNTIKGLINGYDYETPKYDFTITQMKFINGFVGRWLPLPQKIKLLVSHIIGNVYNAIEVEIIKR